MKPGWHRRSLGDVLDVASGQVDPTAPAYSGMPHVGGDNIESGTGRLLGVTTAKNLGLTSGKYLFSPEDVLYSKIRPNLNKVVAPDFEGICSADIYPLRPRKEHVVCGFLVHLLRTEAFLSYARKHSSRTSIPKLNRDGLLAFDALLPPFQEQQRIADILDRADALRAKHRAALALLDTLAESIFLDLFGDPVENPRNWPNTQTLGEVADIVSGITKGRKLKSDAKVRAIPYLAAANVQDRALVLEEMKSIEASEDEIRRYRLVSNDLLLTEGGDPDKLGRGTLWRDELPECIHQNHMFRVRLTTDAIEPLFLNWLVGSQRGKRYFLRSAKQTTGIASINMTQLRGFPLLLPPLALQREFVERIAAVEKLKAAHRASLTELDALFASLQHRAFRGEL